MSTPKHRLEKLCTQLWDSGRHAVWNESADKWEIRMRVVGILRLPTFNKRYRQIQPDEVYQELANGVDPSKIYILNTSTDDLTSIKTLTGSHLQKAIEGTIRGAYSNVFIVEELINSDITSEQGEQQ